MPPSDGHDAVTQRKIEYVAQKWGIPRSDAERMLKNQKAEGSRD